MERFERFLGTRRSPATRRTYKNSILRVTGDPDAFLDLSREQAEGRLIDYFTASRGRYNGNSLQTWLLCVKSFCDFYDVALSWKKVKAVIPPAKKTSSDRAPTLEELRRALTHATLREKVVLLFMASSGVRVGAWKWLRVGDVVKRESIASVRVYRGEPEEYTTFISPEASEALQAYLLARQKAGERMDADSPLLIGRWNEWENKIAETPVGLSPVTVAAILLEAWKKAGVRQKGVRGEFKLAHGLRKFFRSMASRAMSQDDVETLLGHASAYYRPTVEHLEEEYLKAIPMLSIDEKYRLKDELTKTRKEDADYHMKIEHANLLLEKRLREMEEKEGQRAIDAKRLEEVVSELKRRGLIP